MGLLQLRSALRVIAVASALVCSADGALRGAAPSAAEKSLSSGLDPLSICLLSSVDEDMLLDESGKMISVIPVRQEAFMDGVFIQNSQSLQSCPTRGSNSTCFTHHITRRDRVVCELCRYRTSTTKDNPTHANLNNCRKEVFDVAVKLLTTSNSTQNFNQNRQEMAERNLIYADSALGDNPSRWMTSLFNKGLLDGASLNDLVLPGSHNSAAVALESESIVAQQISRSTL
jgi:hypothetical protein